MADDFDRSIPMVTGPPVHRPGHAPDCYCDACRPWFKGLSELERIGIVMEGDANDQARQREIEADEIG